MPHAREGSGKVKEEQKGTKMRDAPFASGRTARHEPPLGGTQFEQAGSMQTLMAEVSNRLSVLIMLRGRVAEH